MCSVLGFRVVGLVFRECRMPRGGDVGGLCHNPNALKATCAQAVFSTFRCFCFFPPW